MTLYKINKTIHPRCR